MKLKPLALFLLFPVLASGCATIEKDKLDELSRQVTGLKASLDDTNSRIEHLNNKFGLLQEKVEASLVKKEEAVPPEGLKVVPLGEDQVKAEDIKQKPAERQPAPAHEPQAQAGPGPKTGEAPEALYNRGHELYIANRFPDARKVFLSLVRENPNHPLADNALYWAGETYYSEKDFESAISKFREVAEKYPRENKTPDAIYKAGLACVELGDNQRAREYFDRVITRYPESEAAAKAGKALEKTGDRKEKAR